MNFELDNDQQAYREAARRFSRQELAPNAADWDANDVFPVETLRRAGDMGFCGLCIPEAHGGLGLSRLDATLIIEELARGCTATTAFLTIHNMVNGILAGYATDSVRETWLPSSSEHINWLTSPRNNRSARSVTIDRFTVSRGSKAQ